MNGPQEDRRHDDRHDRIAVAEGRKHHTQRRLDQHEVGDVAENADGPVSQGRNEAEVVAEPGLGIGEDA